MARFSGMLLIVLLAAAAAAQKSAPDTPLPAGTTGKVLQLSGKVVPIVGIEKAVSGSSQEVNTALRDPGATTTPTEIRINLSSDVLFDFDKSSLRPAAATELAKVATVLRAHGNASCRIEGFTDALGNDRYNQTLSEKRAASVQQWLMSHGVTNPMATHGWGSAKPVAPNKLSNGRDNPDGRQKNRRVEIVVSTG